MRFFHAPIAGTWFLPHCWWRLEGASGIFLSFDDGPHPEITPWVLDQLAAWNAKATFFCVGANVERYPLVYERIISEGHAVGNHTMRHLNAWNTPRGQWLDGVKEAAKHIDSHLVRPPYGKIGPATAWMLAKMGFQLVMWSLITYDFDPKVRLTAIQRKIDTLRGGDIVVMHDQPKAWPMLQKLLPYSLERLAGNALIALPFRPSPIGNGE
ncbi:MAG: polysaccharide deacetylase family protein [Bacteroidetes bacterium]|jgi:peptidoglycan/xylan/chitin deacetylase (PgdA/CDA1 family)|nr:polysaccharide deacetylase family protein [Bacteroidota bacterium]